MSIPPGVVATGQEASSSVAVCVTEVSKTWGITPRTGSLGGRAISEIYCELRLTQATELVLAGCIAIKDTR